MPGWPVFDYMALSEMDFDGKKRSSNSTTASFGLKRGSLFNASISVSAADSGGSAAGRQIGGYMTHHQLCPAPVPMVTRTAS